MHRVLSNLLPKFYQLVQEAVFPPKCLVCGNFFQPPESAPIGRELQLTLQINVLSLLSPFLCPVCIRGLVAVESPLCSCCGLPFKSRQGEDHHCGDCIASPKNFRFARAAVVYEQISTEIIHCFKYKGKLQLARPLSELLLTTFRLFWDKDSIDLIVPVPLHIKRHMKRGFNQAYLLIRNWHTDAAQYLFDFSDLQIERNVLIRTVPTAPQTALGRKRRATNIKNVFDLTDKKKILDKRILLIDDVYTTGATVNECARLLLKHGAKHVDVLTLARAV